MKKSKLVVIFLIAAFLITSGAKCGSGGETATLKLGAPEVVQLEYWRPYDESASFTQIFNDYRGVHPNIQINYRLIRFEDYENELLNAFAEDRGPDIFSVPSNAVNKYLTKIEPLPAKITLPYLVIKGTLQKQEWREYRTTNTLSLRQLKDNFADEVASDVVINNQIYALPYYLDTLALYYNKDLLNNAGISNPPKTWDEFQQDVTKLTTLDRQGNIIQAGAALGTADNVLRSADILACLMMQNGTIMSDSSGNAFFNQMPPNLTGRTLLPSEEALNFYTDFALPTKQTYTWNDRMPNSLNAFMSGKAAFFIGYSYNIATIRAQAPKLNYTISALPQITGNTPLNFGYYWAEVVSKKSKYLNESWDFIQFAVSGSKTAADGSKEYVVKSYLDATKRPTALRTLVDIQKEDIDLAPFAAQILTAKSWYHGINPDAADAALREMINLNIAGTTETRRIIQLGAQKVNQTIR